MALAPLTLDDVALRPGVAPRHIEALAQRIMTAKSVALHMSVGVNMGGFGNLAYALLPTLAVVPGNFNQRGGSHIMPHATAVQWLFRNLNFDNDHRSRVQHQRAIARGHRPHRGV